MNRGDSEDMRMQNADRWRATLRELREVLYELANEQAEYGNLINVNETMKILRGGIDLYEHDPTKAFDFLRSGLSSRIIDSGIPEYILKEMEADFQGQVKKKEKEAAAWKQGVLEKKAEMLKKASGDPDLLMRYENIFSRVTHLLDHHGRSLPGHTVADIRVALLRYDPADFLPADLAKAVKRLNEQ